MTAFTKYGILSEWKCERNIVMAGPDCRDEIASASPFKTVSTSMLQSVPEIWMSFSKFVDLLFWKITEVIPLASIAFHVLTTAKKPHAACGDDTRALKSDTA